MVPDIPPNPEWELIAEIRRRSIADPRVQIGIGDDAALVRHPSGDVLVTTDTLMDGVDFIVGQTPIELIGRKCLAVNLSDIAAMAGRPTAAFISLVLPKSGGRSLADGLYAGIFPLAEEFGVAIAGGDTNSWDGPLVVSVTLLGEPNGNGAIRRSGAKPGDQVYVTGPLGGSLPSLRHCTFIPRVREAMALQNAVNLHALIDLSDGLATDAYHLATESGVGIQIEADRLPIHDDVVADEKSRIEHALTDGEDFELLFCVSPDDAQKLEDAPQKNVTLFRIGQCTPEPGVRLHNNGRITPVAPHGWQHQFL